MKSTVKFGAESIIAALVYAGEAGVEKQEHDACLKVLVNLSSSVDRNLIVEDHRGIGMILFTYYFYTSLYGLHWPLGRIYHQNNSGGRTKK